MFLETHTLPKIVKCLLIITGGVYLLFLLTGLRGQAISWFGFIPFRIIREFQLWRFVTYIFIHQNIFPHLLFNMFALWMFGPELERRLGSSQFLFYYFLTGCGGALLTLLVSPFSGNLYIGASGSIFGLLVAFAILFPDAKIGLIFPPVFLKARHFVIGFGIIQFLMFLEGPSGVGWLVHIGGMITGYIYFLWILPEKAIPKWARARIDRMKSHRQEYYRKLLWELSDKIDPILEKISREGLNSLSRKEKETLEKYRKYKQKAGS